MPSETTSSPILGPSGRPFRSEPAFLVLPGPADHARACAIVGALPEVFGRILRGLPQRAFVDTLRELPRAMARQVLRRGSSRIPIVEFCVHRWTGNGRSPAAKRFAAEAPGRLREAATAMADAHHGVFRVEEQLPHRGLRLRDAVCGREFVLLDGIVDGEPWPQDAWLVGWLAPCGPFWVLAGIPVFAPPLVPAEVIEELVADIATSSDDDRERSLHLAALALDFDAAFEDENPYEDDEPADDLWDESFEVDGADAAAARRPGDGAVRTGPKVGRNQPCPCGSGTKYKRCCGSPLRA